MRPVISIRVVVLVSLSLLAVGCPLRRERPAPALPEVVPVVVEKLYAPTWATEELPFPEPADDSIAADWLSNEQRGAMLRLVYCHRRLLARAARGEVVSPRECTP